MGVGGLNPRCGQCAAAIWWAQRLCGTRGARGGGVHGGRLPQSESSDVLRPWTPLNRL
jgi:hypothetical protein